MAKYVIKLRLLRGVYPSLSRRAVNAITRNLVREKRGRFNPIHNGEGDTKTEHREMWPQAKECQQPPDDGAGKEYILPGACREGVAL